MAHPRIHYAPLQTDPTPTKMVESVPDLSELKPEHQSHQARTTYFLPILICALCTVLNVAVFHFTAPALPPAVTSAPLSRNDIWKLRRPSQYIRLDEIQRPSPPVAREFDNFPIAVAQVDSREKGRVFDNEGKMHMGASGLYVPDDRQIVISERVSTVVQFFAFDFGMERCELQLVVDARSISNDHTARFTLEIYTLNSTFPVDTDTLSYNTRPPRIAKVASLDVGEGDVRWHRSFHCATGTFLTFELACVPAAGVEDCRMQWWQTKELESSAIYITQHATL